MKTRINTETNTVTFSGNLPLQVFAEMQKESGTFEWYTRERISAKSVVNTYTGALKIIQSRIKEITVMSPYDNSNPIPVTELYSLMRMQQSIKTLNGIFVAHDKKFGGYGLFTKWYNTVFEHGINWHDTENFIHSYTTNACNLLSYDLPKYRDSFLRELSSYGSVSLYAVTTHKLLDQCTIIWLLEGRKSMVFCALMRVLSGQYKECNTVADIADYLREESVTCYCLNVERETNEIDISDFEPMFTEDEAKAISEREG